MKKYLGLFLLFGTLVACNKDKFQTKPQLKLKSVNTSEVPYNSTLSVTLEFTDKEGDVTDSLFVARERLNIKRPVAPPTLEFAIPDFPKRSQGEFEVNIDFLSLVNGMISIEILPRTSPATFERDTVRLKFFVKDKAGNFSDTLTLNDIFVERR